MKTAITLIIFLFSTCYLNAQTVIFEEKFDGMPSYNLTGWPYHFTGIVPWQCGIPFTVGPCMIPLGAAMAENSGTNKVACFAECSGTDHHDSNVLTSTPLINMGPVSGAWLKYDSYFAGYISPAGNTEKATVEISTDSGSTWTVLEHVAPSVPQGLFNTHYIDLSAYDHIGNIRIGFRYNDDDGFLMMGWAIDNVTVFIPARKDLAVLSATPTDTMLSYLVPGQSHIHKVKIYNQGLDTVHSFRLFYQQDSGPIMANLITGLNMPAFATTVFSHNIPDTVFTTGRHTIKVWAALDSDANHANDSAITHLTGVDFMPSKRLAIESGEGTYNGWSPRNIYYLKMVPLLDVPATLISIHEFDPMVDTPYHDFMFNLGWNYVPYILFDRRKSIPLDSFFYYLDVQKQYFGFANMQLSSFNDIDGINVTAKVTPALDMTGDFRLVLVLTEDGVTGTTIAWDQVNNYAFNAHGPMGGFETMANPIPAASMVYNYVARKAFPSPDGQPGMLPSTLNSGIDYSYTFTTTLDPAWNPHKVKAKVLLIRHNDSTVLNSNEIRFPVEVTNVNATAFSAGVYPNPAQEDARLYFNLNSGGTVHLTLTDLTGRTLYTHPITQFSAGRNEIELPVDRLGSGLYIVNVQTDEGSKSIKMEVIH